MSDRSEWVQSIVDTLANSLGSSEQKRAALQAAIDMEAALPSGSPNADKMARYLKGMFEGWIHHMRYLAVPISPDHALPDSLLRSDAEVAREYGLTSKVSIQAKQEQIAAAREDRIRRAAGYLADGWEPRDIICFCGGKDEWRIATRQQQARVA